MQTTTSLLVPPHSVRVPHKARPTWRLVSCSCLPALPFCSVEQHQWWFPFVCSAWRWAEAGNGCRWLWQCFVYGKLLSSEPSCRLSEDQGSSPLPPHPLPQFSVHTVPDVHPAQQGSKVFQRSRVGGQQSEGKFDWGHFHLPGCQSITQSSNRSNNNKSFFFPKLTSIVLKSKHEHAETKSTGVRKNMQILWKTVKKSLWWRFDPQQTLCPRVSRDRSGMITWITVRLRNFRHR